MRDRHTVHTDQGCVSANSDHRTMVSEITNDIDDLHWYRPGMLNLPHAGPLGVLSEIINNVIDDLWCYVQPFSGCVKTCVTLYQ